MPYREHAEYLRRLFSTTISRRAAFRPAASRSRCPISATPIFAVGTETDHVAPWRSVYKLNLLTDAEVTFLLTSGGHNVGIVSEPGHPRRHYRVATRTPEDHYENPDAWTANTPIKEGSWWPEWIAWLDARSGKPVAPPRMGAQGSAARHWATRPARTSSRNNKKTDRAERAFRRSLAHDRLQDIARFWGGYVRNVFIGYDSGGRVIVRARGGRRATWLDCYP